MLGFNKGCGKDDILGEYILINLLKLRNCSEFSLYVGQQSKANIVIIRVAEGLQQIIQFISLQALCRIELQFRHVSGA